MPIFEAALLFRLAAKGPSRTRIFVVAVRIEGRVDVDEVDAGVGQFAGLIEVVAAIDDAGVDHGRGFGRAAFPRSVARTKGLRNACWCR